MTLDCWVDANPQPEIRWLHRFTNAANEEIDLSRQFSSNSPLQTDVWFIKQEQVNATRWKTSLFIQVSTLLVLHYLFTRVLAYSSASVELRLSLSSEESSRSRRTFDSSCSNDLLSFANIAVEYTERSSLGNLFVATEQNSRSIIGEHRASLVVSLHLSPSPRDTDPFSLCIYFLLSLRPL